MAYIDFYRNDIQYRCNIGELYSTNIGTLSKNVNKVTCTALSVNASENDYYMIKSVGTDLCELFNVDNIDWTSPPDTTPHGYGYVFTNADKTLYLWITRQKEINYEANGTISEYSYHGYQYYIAMGSALINNNSFILSSAVFIRPDNNLSGKNSAPSNAKNGTFPPTTSPCMMGIKVIYEGKEYIAMIIKDPNVYKAYKVIYGTKVMLTTNQLQVFGAGCTYEKAGIGLRVKSKRTIMVTDAKGNWTYGGTAINRQLVAYTDYVGSDYRLLDMSQDEVAFSLSNDTQPDNPNFPQYPDDGDNDDSNGDTGEDGGNSDEPTGGDGNHDKESEDVTDTEVVPSYSITGLMTIYELTQNSIAQLGKNLWSDNILQKFLKITGNPIDSIIGLYISYIDFENNGSSNIYLGNVEIEMTAPLVKNPIKTLNAGTTQIEHFWGDFKDYNPFTKISIYLPYIGVQDLSVNEIMNSSISLTYRFNLLSNTCVALITVQKTIDETQLNSVLYQFDGSFLEEIPISAASNNTKISARLAQLGAINTAVRQAGNVAYNNKMQNGQKALNIGTSVVNTGVNIMQYEIDAHHLDVARTGALKGSAGILAINKPYLIIERCIPSYPTSYAKNEGVPLNRTLKLSQLKGFTQVLEIFISNFTGLQSEYAELITLLQQGVVF